MNTRIMLKEEEFAFITKLFAIKRSQNFTVK